MCGIAGIFNIQSQTPELRNKALRMAQKIRHRGPDWSGIYVGGSAILAHERLSIVDPESGGQPLYSPDHKQVLAVNGEIYNHRDIRARYAGKYAFQTGSDCEVILALYKDKGIRFLEELNGIFAFALYDEETDDYLIARDPIGVIPLYIGRDKDGHIYFGSELKALEGFCDEYEPFLPGHYYRGREGKMHRWYTRDWMDYAAVKDNYTPAAERNAAPASIGRTAYSTQVTAVHDALEAAVQRQLMSDVPYGVLLSGGLDSSVISAIAKKYAAKRIETDNKADAWWPQLHSFAVGLKGAPDLIKAREVARHIGTVHHEINYTVQEGLDAVRDVIYFIETYDITTVRASTPHVSAGTCHQKHGHQDGTQRRRCGRGVRRLPLLPQGAHPASLSRRNRAQALQTASVRLPPCQQKPCSLGSGRTCPLPRQRIPGCCHAHQSGSQDVPRQGDRKESSPRSLCRHTPPERCLAAERTVLRRCGLQLD